VLAVGQVLLAGAQDVPDPVQRVALAATVAVDVLLDPAADFVHDAGGEFDDVEGVQHGAGVLQLVVDGVLIAVEGVAISTRARNASPRWRSQVL
jgi:hypothetical protein